MMSLVVISKVMSNYLHNIGHELIYNDYRKYGNNFYTWMQPTGQVLGWKVAEMIKVYATF